MTDKYDCGGCGVEIEIREWENGYCPHCGIGYEWDEYCTEDYSDCWSCLLWGDACVFHPASRDIAIAVARKNAPRDKIA